MTQLYTFDEQLSDFYKSVQEYLKLKNIQKAPHLNSLKHKLENSKKDLLNSIFSSDEFFREEIKIIDQRISYVSQAILDYHKDNFSQDMQKKLDEYSKKDFYKEYSNIVKNSDKIVFDSLISINFKRDHWRVSEVKEVISEFSKNFDCKLLEYSLNCLIYLKSDDLNKFKEFLNFQRNNNYDIYYFNDYFKPIIPFQQEQNYDHLGILHGLDIFQIEKENQVRFSHIKSKEYYEDDEYFIEEHEDIHLSNDPDSFNKNIEFYDIENIDIDSLKENYILIKKQINEENDKLLEEYKAKEQEHIKFNEFSIILNQLYLDIISYQKITEHNYSISEDNDTNDILSFLQNKNEVLIENNFRNYDEKKLIERYLECIKNSPDYIFDIIVDRELSSNNNSLKLFLDCNNKKYDIFQDDIVMKITDLKEFIEQRKNKTANISLRFVPPIPYKKTIENNSLSGDKYINSILSNKLFTQQFQNYGSYKFEQFVIDHSIENIVKNLTHNLSMLNIRDFSPNINTRNKNKP